MQPYQILFNIITENIFNIITEKVNNMQKLVNIQATLSST